VSDMSDVSATATRCTSAHSLLTCGYLSQPRVRLYCGSGHRERGGREGSGPRLDLLGLRVFGNFLRFTSVRTNAKGHGKK